MDVGIYYIFLCMSHLIVLDFSFPSLTIRTVLDLRLVFVFQISYHVVFFDKQVSRAWINAACIRNFSCDDDPDDMGKVC